MTSLKRAILVGSLTVGTSLAALDAAIIGTTMPSLISSLGGLPFDSWTFSVYLLASTIVIPMSGRLADLFGRKPVYMSGMALFLAGSFLCGLAQTLEQLILYRAIQGLGAGAILPIAITIVADVFPPEGRARIQGLLGAAWSLAAILGPAVGVVLIQNLAWHWAFLVNLPLGLASAILVALSLEERTEHKSKRAIDYWGGATFAAAVTILLSTLLNASISSEGFSLDDAGLLAISGALFGLFLLVESTAREPMLPLSLFLSNPTIRWCSITGVLIGMAMLGAISYVPVFAQGVIGGIQAEAQAGATLIPLGIGLAIGSGAAGYTVLRLGYRHTVLTGAASVFMGSIMLTLLDASSTPVFAAAAMAPLGLGLGFATTALLVAVQNSVNWDQQGVASSSVQFLRTFGGIVGVSILGFLLNSHMTGGFAAMLAEAPFDSTLSLGSLGLLANPGLATSIELGSYLSTRDTLASGLHLVFWGILGFAILALVASLFIPAKELATETAEHPQVEET